MNDAEFRAHLHTALCRVADLVLFRYNPCDRNAEGCLAGEDCCTRLDGMVCPWLGETGCTLPNIGCKVAFCAAAKERMEPEVRETFAKLDELARLWDVHNGARAD